jgi:hypothetical protein
MSLPATVTINCGSPAADVVFGNPRRQGNGILYTAPSPQDDLAGQLTLLVSTETTKAGIERTLRKIVEPVYDSATSSYPDRIETTTVLARKRTADHGVNGVGRAQEMMSKLLDDTNVNAAVLLAIL